MNIKIKDFVTGYEKIATESLKDRYIKDNLEIKSYLPFLRKDALASVLAERTTYKHEPYTKEDGTIGQKKTDVIRVNSTAQYILFCRVVIENYTNLTVEAEGFFEEYDLLKQSGLLDKLMVGTEQVAPLIPADEISELRSLLDMKQKDILFNQTEVHNYVNSLVERFGDIIDVMSKPIMEKVAERMKNSNSIADDEENVKGNDFLEVVK